MKTSTITLIIVFLITYAIVIFLGSKLILSSMELRVTKDALKIQETNSKAIAFLKLFIEDVLMSKDPVPFEERLQLENAIREINDQKVFDQWQTFLKSEKPDDIRANAKVLLKLVIDKACK